MAYPNPDCTDKRCKGYTVLFPDDEGKWSCTNADCEYQTEEYHEWRKDGVSDDLATGS